MDTLTFTTPAKAREPQPVPANWCGEELTIRKPKDSVLYFASAITGNDVADSDRAAALFEFLSGTLEPVDHKRFLERIQTREDRLNLSATVALVQGLLERWNDWPGEDRVTPVVAEPDDTATGPVAGEPARVVHDELDLDLTVHPPKDIVLMLVSASISTNATIGQQAWAIGLFLDAALDPADSFEISTRLRDRDDDLDLHHIAEIVADLIERWAPRRNRAQRRAAARAGQ